MSSWTWTSQDKNSNIYKFYYVYALEYNPLVYNLFAQMRDGSVKKFNILKESDCLTEEDKRGFLEASKRPFEIPVLIPPPTSKEKKEKRERGPSCSIV